MNSSSPDYPDPFDGVSQQPLRRHQGILDVLGMTLNYPGSGLISPPVQQRLVRLELVKKHRGDNNKSSGGGGPC